MFEKSKRKLTEVHQIKRPGIGAFYIGHITVAELYRQLDKGVIKYFPRQQRGLPVNPQQGIDSSSAEYEKLLTFDDARLRSSSLKGNLGISENAERIATKYLMGFAETPKATLFNPGILWNIRKENGVDIPVYDANARTLSIDDDSTIVVPDSAHRHYAYKLVYEWHQDRNRIPDEVIINPEDSVAIRQEEIAALLDRFAPDDEEKADIAVEIYNLDKEQEGALFVELNNFGVRASVAASYDINPSQSYASAFMADLLSSTKVFSRDEVETRQTNISKASRKLTTNSTIVGAVKPFSTQIGKLMRSPGPYSDLIEFVDAFFLEWGQHNTAFLPNASYKERLAARLTSFCTQNIILFPMFQFALEYWFEGHENGTLDWKNKKDWKQALAKWSSNVSSKDADGNEVVVPVMARDFAGQLHDPNYPIAPSVGNKAWVGKILLEKTNKAGETVYSLNNTRDSRQAAYNYLKSLL